MYDGWVMRALVDPFAYARTGELLVGADLNALYAYSGANERKMWSAEASAQVVNLGVIRGQVVSVDVSGVIERRDMGKGDLVTQVALVTTSSRRATPRAMALATQGTCAVALPDRVAVEESGSVRYFMAQDVIDIDFRDDGMALAVGLANGEVRLVDLMGHVLGATRFEAPVDGLCWSSEGVWLVSTGGSIVAWDGLHQDVRIDLATSESLGSPTCSTGGSIVAFRLGSSLVQIHELSSGASLGEVESSDRPVGSLQFGPALWLAVGSSCGDGHRIDLATSALHRTEGITDSQQGLSGSLRVRLRTEQIMTADGGRSLLPERDELEPVRLPQEPRDEAGAVLQLRRKELTLCCGCGAPKDTVICSQCGAVNGNLESRAEERAALDDYREVLNRPGAVDKCRVLREGWIPTDREVLLEAAERTKLLLGAPGRPPDDLAEAAALRFELIIDGLKHSTQSPELFKRILELDQHLSRLRARKKRRWPLALLIALLLSVVGAFGFWLLWY